MKKVYVKPILESEAFVPNDYVAACVVGTIECAIPGYNEYACDGSSPIRKFDYNIDTSRWDGPTIEHDTHGYEHGNCGNSASISFDSNTGSGFETNNDGSIKANAPIYNITGYSLTAGPHKVTWQSNSGGPTYNHYGILNISYIDYNRPNHS